MSTTTRAAIVTRRLTLALAPCASCGRLCHPDALIRLPGDAPGGGRWRCADRAACTIACHARARIVATLRHRAGKDGR